LILSPARRGDNTYANYTEANRVFWRQTVIPLVQRTAPGLSRWLGPAYGRGLVLRPDLDSLDALSGDRDAQWTRLQATTFLTDDEKRALVGYGPKPLELAHKYNPDQPRDDRGRWEDGGGFGGKIPRDVANPVADGERPLREAAGKKPYIVPAPKPADAPKDKSPVPGLSGKEGAKDVPSWAKEFKPKVGENGGQFADRILKEKYGNDYGKNPTS
jgi:hypothetical protein